MPARFFLFVSVLVIVFVLLDFYTYKALSLLFSGKNYFRYIKIIHWAVLPAVIIILVIASTLFTFDSHAAFMHLVFLLTGTLILFYGPKIVLAAFHLAEDLLYGISLLVRFVKGLMAHNTGETTMARPLFLTRAGAFFFALMFLLLLKGMVTDRFSFKIRMVDIAVPGLPAAFEGTTIVQLSDFHLASFHKKEKRLKKMVDMVNSLDADYIVFTGDLVNNLADEAKPFVDILSGLKARYGKFSILGNHDYGEYHNWPSEEERLADHNKLISYHKEIGFDLLMNENRTLKKGNDSMAIIGVENWGLPPFKQYGDLAKALEGIEETGLKILLSHDPSHWDAEIKGKTDIALTLSGHTHGMQFGIYSKKFKWSPVSWKYKKWAGLYSKEDQYLYVNVGLGSIGFPGRVGMPPEITLLTLKGIKDRP